MSDVTVTINGVPRLVPDDVTVAVALLRLGPVAFRHSVRGMPRAPLCAMGSCFECRVTIDGTPGVRACLEPVRDGQVVETSE